MCENSLPIVLSVFPLLQSNPERRMMYACIPLYTPPPLTSRSQPHFLPPAQIYGAVNPATESSAIGTSRQSSLVASKKAQQHTIRSAMRLFSLRLRSLSTMVQPSKVLVTAVKGIPAVRAPDVRLLNRVAVSYLSMAKAALKQRDIYQAREHAQAAHKVVSTLAPADGSLRSGRSDVHPIGIGAAEIISLTFQAEGRFADAVSFAREVATHDVEVLGGTHPLSIKSTTNLAATLSSVGEAHEAELLLRRASDDLRAVSSRDFPHASLRAAERAVSSPECLKVDALLGRTLAMQGKLEQATEVMSSNVDAARALSGGSSSDHLRAIADYSEVLMDRGLFSRAEPLLANHFQVSLERHGPPSSSKETHISGLRYADVLEAQGKLLESANMLMNVFGRSHPRAIKVVAALRGFGGLVDPEEARQAGCPGKGSCTPEQHAACKTPC